jgi:hypothetical protein
MLSTITAADVQFRHEEAQRRREIALMAAIRERRAAEGSTARAAVVKASTTRRPERATWPRPIHVTATASASAACVA